MMRCCLPLVMALAAGPAFAELPPQECYDEGVGGYDIYWAEDGFVAYFAGDYATSVMDVYIDDCAGGQRLKMSTAPAADYRAAEPAQSALADAVDKALASKQGYTLAQIGAMGREAGAKVKLGKASYVSCACERRFPNLGRGG